MKKKTNKDLSEDNIQNNCESSDHDQDMHKTVGGVVHTTYLFTLARKMTKFILTNKV